MVTDPARSGVVWDAALASSGLIARDVVGQVERDPEITDAFDARWARAVKIDGSVDPDVGHGVVEG